MAVLVLVLVLTVLLSAMAGHSSGMWCVCKEGIDDVKLQKTLDYACGAGADCLPIHHNRPCFEPNTVNAHCSYAANSFFQNNNQSQGSCDFSGTATIYVSDPSYGGCVYPATASAAAATTPATTTTPTTNVPATTTPMTNVPDTTSPTTGTTAPYSSMPYTGAGVMGGAGNGGFGSTGAGGINTDYADTSGSRIENPNTNLPTFFIFTLLLMSCI